MNSAAIDAIRKEFLRFLPDFRDFENPPKKLADGELAYKHAAVEKTRAILGAYVNGKQRFESDTEARETLSAVLKLTNFLNWRDLAYIPDELLEQDGDWLKFAQLILPCLRGANSDEWKAPLQELLDWLTAKKCRANISKLLPTYFLFLWSPGKHFCIKSDFVDTFLKKWLKEEPLGQGKPLTVEKYERLLRILQEFRAKIGDWKPRDNIDVHSLAWIVTAIAPRNHDESPGSEARGPISPPPPNSPPPKLALNVILAGPPGTGKTHRVLTQFQPLFEETVQQTREEFAFALCSELRWHEICVVSLRLLGRSARVPEILETLPVTAKSMARDRGAGISNTLWVSMANHTPESCKNVSILTVRSEPALFLKNEDPTWKLIEGVEEIVPELIALADKIKNYQPASTILRRHDFVTFHQSYSYEDFVEGIKPDLVEVGADGEAGPVRYTVQPGIFMRIARRATADPDHPYALFIDEINRANISNVFGELISLLEQDKRMIWNPTTKEWERGIRVKLPYTHSTRPSEPLFGVPANLHVVGTMNSADRSIALLDLALRRRFTFEEIMPEPKILAANPGPITTTDGETIHLDRLLDAMNRRIEFLFDRDHTIGHSYLMEAKSLDDLDRVFRQRIIPLLQEYFYGDWHKIQLVLGDLTDEDEMDGRKKLHPEAIIKHDIQRPDRLFGTNDDTHQDRRSYCINDELSVGSFTKIYTTLTD